MSEGIIILDQICQSNSMFVSKTLLFLKGKPNNLNRIINILKIYYKASNTKIN